MNVYVILCKKLMFVSVVEIINPRWRKICGNVNKFSLQWKNKSLVGIELHNVNYLNVFRLGQKDNRKD